MKHSNADQRRNHVGTMTTSIHSHRAADRTRYSDGPLKTGQSMVHALSGQNRKRSHCACNQNWRFTDRRKIYQLSKRSESYGDAAEADLTDQHIATPTHHNNGDFNFGQRL